MLFFKYKYLQFVIKLLEEDIENTQMKYINDKLYYIFNIVLCHGKTSYIQCSMYSTALFMVQVPIAPKQIYWTQFWDCITINVRYYIDPELLRIYILIV